jgi:hypothetical protein
MAGGVAANGIARWNGASWSAVGLATGGSAEVLAVLPNGDLIAGGNFSAAGASYLARWNGVGWSALGPSLNNMPTALAVLPNGDLVVGGLFTMAGGVAADHIARWNGTGWSPLGTGINGIVNALTTMPNGDLVAGGGFGTQSIARWDGTLWRSLGSGIFGGVDALMALPNGHLIAAGQFFDASGVAVNNIARWSGSNWSTIEAGLDGRVRALRLMPSGDLVAGGNFMTANGLVAAHVARLTTSCPAMVSAVGASCPGSGGANAYSALNMPWTGSTYLARGTGLAAFALVAMVTGFRDMSMPLNAFLSSPSGCLLLASPDSVDFTMSISGVVDTRLVVPNTTLLAGAVLHQQLVVFETDPALGPVQVTSSNALTVTLGVF